MKHLDILEYATEYKDLTVSNLSNLLKIQSTSRSEKEVADALKRMMLEAHFDEVTIDGLGNVIGRIGNGNRIIAIDGHIDTVDVGNINNWKFDPLGGEVIDGHVFGRGSVDQKGGVASFITAGKILKEIGVPKDLTIYFTGTVMEEDCDGLCWKYIVEERRIKPECVIITEPTNLAINRGQRGRMELEVTFHGISSHGSAPERGKNAIYLASKAALEIEKLNDRLTSDEFFGKGSVTVTKFVSTSPSLCAVPDMVKIHLDRRLTWREDKEKVVREIAEIFYDKKNDVEITLLNYNEKSYSGLKYGMEKYYPTWKLEENHPVIQKGVKVFKNLFKEEPKIDKWTFSTNGVAINGIYQIPVIGFGPGNEELAHAPNEKVPVDHLIKASAFYASYCLGYL